MRTTITSAARLLFATALSFTLLAAPSTATAEQPLATQASHEMMAAWIPYDYVNYTTNTKCNNRLRYLRTRYPDMHLGNTECRAVSVLQCPPKTVYWIYILDKAGYRVAGISSEAAPHTISPDSLSLAC